MTDTEPTGDSETVTNTESEAEDETVTNTEATANTETTTDTEVATGGVAGSTETDSTGADETPGPETLLCCSLEESTGKTAMTLALAQLAREGGDQVGYMKPKGTRLQSNVGKTLDEDPMLARDVLDLDAEMHDLEPVVYSPTFVEGAIRGREDVAALHERVREAFETLAVDTDRMFLEGGGRIELGGVVDLTDVDVAELLGARVVLVATYEEPEDVDDVLAVAGTVGDRFAGVVFNAVPDSAFDRLESDVVPFLENRDVPVHGVLPRERTLAGVTVADLAEELGAKVLVDDGLDEYVERFSVGAMGADSALRHFRRTKNAAVVTGGDRSEIHTAALEAPGVRCLLLTGGHRPPGTVVGHAAEKGVPILTVQTDTLTTVERAEDVVRSGRVRDVDTVERMRSLLSDHANVDAILGG